MHVPYLRTWLVVVGSLLTQASLAQRAPVELLTPTRVGMQTTAPATLLGQEIATKATEAATSQPAVPAGASTASQARPVIPPPLLLVNARIIVSGLAKIAPSDIADIIVYKGSAIPAGWQSTTAGGVINLTLKQGVKVPSVSLARLKRRQHIRGPVRFELDGRPLADTSLRIAADDISKVEVSPTIGQDGCKVLNIKLSVPIEEPAKYPPGTIFIRGVAGQ